MGGGPSWRHCFLPKSPEHSTPSLAASKTPTAGRSSSAGPAPSVPLSLVPVSFPPLSVSPDLESLSLFWAVPSLPAPPSPSGPAPSLSLAT